MDWTECCNKRIVKEVSKDQDFVNSLLKTSMNKLKSMEILELNDVTADSKISLAYDSLRELLEAFSLKKGYKIYNHECYTPFLKEIVIKSELGDEFDELRKLRNQVNYYGKEASIQDARIIISRIINLRKKIVLIFEKA